jgi:GDP-mannose 6-dehydrogenase
MPVFAGIAKDLVGISRPVPTAKESVLKISVFGLGFVGTVTSGCLAAGGHELIGVDNNEWKIEALQSGRAPIVEPEIEELLARSKFEGRLHATMDANAAVAGTDMSLICVDVGTGPDGSQNTASLEQAVHDVGAAIAAKGKFHSVVIRSTLLPTTTRRLVLPILEQSTGKVLGTGFGLAYHPEFIREGSGVSDFRNAMRTIIGEFDAATAEMLIGLYREFSASIFRTTPELSEAAKYADNAWHAVKVTFANEIATICNAEQIDSAALMEMFCADSRLNISKAYLNPGYGFGGSCLAKDVTAIVHRSEKAGLDLPLLSNVIASNQRHIQRSVDWIVSHGRNRFAVLGLAYKAGTGDLRNSPYLQIALALRSAGKEVRAFDVDVSRATAASTTTTHFMDEGGDSLLTDDLQALATWCDTIVICNYTPEYSQILQSVGTEKTILDFARKMAIGTHPLRIHAFV